MKAIHLVVAGVLGLAPQLAADELHIELDSELTSITFRLQATMHSVHGSAAAVSGSMRLNTGDGAMAGKVRVDAATAETGNTKRDKKMHTKVLRSSTYPRIELVATHLEGDLALIGPSDVTLHGEMEILGRRHEIGVPLHVEIDGGRFSAKAEFEIPYVEWGLEDPSTFVLRVAKVVQVTVLAEGSVNLSAPPL